VPSRGRPSGLAIDKNDMLYVVDSQSSDAPSAANYNLGCQRGIRVGSVKDGKVIYFIPPPVPPDPEDAAANRHRSRWQWRNLRGVR
jgi:hypothetical protein